MAYGNRGRGTSSRESLRRRMDMRTSSLGSPSTPFRVMGDLPAPQGFNRPTPPTAQRPLATAPTPDPQPAQQMLQMQQEALAEMMRRRMMAMQMQQAQPQPRPLTTAPTPTPYQLPPVHNWQPVSVTPFSMGGM